MTIGEAMDADVVFSMLADDQAVLQCFDAHSLAQARKGAIHVNMATVGLDTADRMADLHTQTGVTYVAAPVLGRPQVAAAGNLNIIAAGPAEAVQAVSPYLDVLGKRTWVVGDVPRSANLVKIGVNYNLIHALQAISESVTLIEEGGVDAGQFIEILTDAAFTGSAYGGYGPKIAARDYVPTLFSLRLGLKDLSLAEQAAEAEGVTLLSANVLRDVFERALRDPELSELDWSSIAEVSRSLTINPKGYLHA